MEWNKWKICSCNTSPNAVQILQWNEAFYTLCSMTWHWTVSEIYSLGLKKIKPSFICHTIQFHTVQNILPQHVSQEQIIWSVVVEKRIRPFFDILSPFIYDPASPRMPHTSCYMIIRFLVDIIISILVDITSNIVIYLNFHSIYCNLHCTCTFTVNKIL